MKKYRLEITPYARDQMRDIRDYITYVLMNPTAAKNLINTIQTHAEKLKENPARIKSIEEEPWGKQGIRKLIVKNYYVYFWIDEKHSTVHVIDYRRENRYACMTDEAHFQFRKHMFAVSLAMYYNPLYRRTTCGTPVAH